MTDKFDIEARALASGHSLRSLAAAIDVPESSIRRVRDGLGIHPRNAKKIADHFDLEVADLIPSAKEAA